ncbi:LacI family DNA-binding transcriptional regulator [Pelagicoccus sp. NFK12]|uniref:LacI family DNA-binding transcriptional regulator n=1 Tax=Pelagicoccus enzymogenes TaxID=2773457 RepID=A0A927F4T6_9BACT|nr:LacI family DNA-binding transcriptional regulator [Pelagicoccus enzymogenes]MBD5778075.1 LacI family DNA-binding transcriptional regulator [Pelagicoccus enzymogenes]MDQ8198169.1 LacI family DNA-binding transcriptional regulator [Pelagicoccus enzymogenes]
MSVRKIASKLGLSPSTVSLALRSSPKISADTRERVLREAEGLGYKPNAKLNELMSHLRLNGSGPTVACFGVISFYDTLRPWEGSRHLTAVYEAMRSRGEALGYRLESLGLKAPGMNAARFSSVLDTRGIQGLLCFGSPNFEEEFPKELDHYAVVTIGLSISTPLHRVTSHFFNDLYRTLERLHAMGYRRPGLLLNEYEEGRTAHSYPSAYLGWCEHALGNASLMPILRTTEVSAERTLEWVLSNRPDVIVCVHHRREVEKLQMILEGNGMEVPRDVGIAAVTQLLDGTRFSGMQQNQRLMGEWAVELLVSRIMNQDLGIPTNPRIEMVESEWIEGETLLRRQWR